MPGTVLGPRNVALSKKPKFSKLMELVFYLTVCLYILLEVQKNEFLKVETRSHFIKSFKNLYMWGGRVAEKLKKKQLYM